MVRDLPGRPDRPDVPDPADRPGRPRTRDHLPQGEPLGEGVLEPYQKRLDRSDTPVGDTPREAIKGFRPERAGLDPITGDEAKQYARAHVSDRPWLNHAQYVGGDTARVLVAADRGGGHMLERHGSTVTPEMTEARAKRLEDPAIGDDAARTPGKDAFKRGQHACGDVATRIRDPHAFATCFVRGVEHPSVRATLDRPYDPDDSVPDPVTIPLADLLGPDGYKYCDGHRLEPVGGRLDAARDCRVAWADATDKGREPDVPEPTVTRMEPEEFRDAGVLFAFRPKRDRTGLEISTMYVEPRRTGQP